VTIPPDGRPAAPSRTFKGGGNFQSLVWSPDGAEILFVRAAPSTAAAGAQIAAFDLARAEIQELYVAPVLTQAMTARWDRLREPRVVFSRESSQQQTFSLALRDGKAVGDPVRLPLPNPYIPSLSPDGRWMVFASLADGTGLSSLWLADSRGSNARKIAERRAKSPRVSMSPAGLRMAATSPSMAATFGASRLRSMYSIWIRRLKSSSLRAYP
jgi:Tol biopolymer transport system component